ncbi:MAG TPA: VWA domain-containing protein [Candidatus Brocadiia bacterium]|nr:VWA domain-containing protein [Candidatus Brocadiia bacterium]
MSFLFPWVFLVAGLPALAALLLLYFLKMKRQELLVGSNLLWRKSVDDMRANTPFQRLRRNLLLLLQILILASLVTAASGPTRMGRAGAGKSLLILVDHSASMGAREAGGGTRLDAARSLVRDMIAGLRSSDQAAIISFASRARLRAPMTRNAAELRDALDEIEIEDSETFLRQALSIAYSSAQEHPNPEIIVVSDGKAIDLGNLPKPAVTVPVTFAKVGETGDNVAMTSLALRPGLASGEEDVYQLFVTVENFSQKERETVLELYISGQGEIQDAARLKLPAGGRESRIFEAAGVEDETLTVKLSGQDALAGDNTASTVVPTKRQFAMLIIGENDPFFERAITRSLSVQISRLSAADFAKEYAEKPFNCESGKCDIALFHTVAPKSLGQGRFLFVNCLPEPSWAAQGAGEGRIEYPEILDWNQADPVTRFVSFGDTVIRNAARMKPPEDAKTLLDGASGPLIVSQVGLSRRLVALGFDPRDSNWPLRAGFPIFVANALRWLLEEEGRGVGFHARPGEIVRLRANSPGQAYAIEDPAGRPVSRGEADDAGFATFPAPAKVGVYSCKFEGGVTGRFAVNLLSRAESDLAPAADLDLGNSKVAAMTDRQLQMNRPLWPHFVIAAMVFLIAEWFIYTGWFADGRARAG